MKLRSSGPQRSRLSHDQLKVLDWLKGEGRALSIVWLRSPVVRFHDPTDERRGYPITHVHVHRATQTAEALRNKGLIELVPADVFREWLRLRPIGLTTPDVYQISQKGREVSWKPGEPDPSE